MAFLHAIETPHCWARLAGQRVAAFSNMIAVLKRSRPSKLGRRFKPTQHCLQMTRPVTSLDRFFRHMHSDPSFLNAIIGPPVYLCFSAGQLAYPSANSDSTTRTYMARFLTKRRTGRHNSSRVAATVTLGWVSSFAQSSPRANVSCWRQSELRHVIWNGCSSTHRTCRRQHRCGDNDPKAEIAGRAATGVTVATRTAMW